MSEHPRSERGARHAPGALAAVLLIVLVAAARVAVAAVPPPSLRLSPCELEHPLRLTVVAADCGILPVAENPAAPGGRAIGLRVARVAAISRRKRPDPLFVLAGGPGQAAGEFYATFAGAFARLHRDHDIVLIDQRGTGGSNRLACAQPQDLAGGASDAQIAAGTRDCLAALAARADVAFYTTSLAVQDLERVRAALGYERINLYGASYGTRVAQHYLRRFPTHTRSLILDGVVPVELALGEGSPLVAERALENVLGRCARASECRARFGDPLTDYRSVRAALAGGAVAVTIADPSTGAPTDIAFGAEQLATVLRLMSYTSDYAALLPIVLHGAAQRRDYAPLAAQFLEVERAYDAALALGMHNSVVCAEDLPFVAARTVDRAALAATYLGTRQLDGLAIVCGLWPHGPVDADLHAPLSSDVPVLLLSGSDDPVTPPAYAEQAARGFANSLSVVLAGFGHGQLTAPCMDRLMQEFLALGSARGLDASCTQAARPLPFFTSVNGPPP